MKKAYLKPDMMISLFDTKDVITDSNTGDSPTTGGLTTGDNASIGPGGDNSGNIIIPFDKL